MTCVADDGPAEPRKAKNSRGRGRSHPCVHAVPGLDQCLWGQKRGRGISVCGVYSVQTSSCMWCMVGPVGPFANDSLERANGRPPTSNASRVCPCVACIGPPSPIFLCIGQIEYEFMSVPQKQARAPSIIRRAFFVGYIAKEQASKKRAEESAVNDQQIRSTGMDPRWRPAASAKAAAGAEATRGGSNDELLLGLEASSMVRGGGGVCACVCWRVLLWAGAVTDNPAYFLHCCLPNRRCWPSTTRRWGSSGRSRSGRRSSRRWAVRHTNIKTGWSPSPSLLLSFIRDSRLARPARPPPFQHHNHHRLARGPRGGALAGRHHRDAPGGALARAGGQGAARRGGM